MAQMFEIEKVTIGPRVLVARVELAPGAPLMTSDDPEGTARVLELLPGLADHACLGDASERFGEVAEDTELAHLLEHVTVELLAQTDVAGDIASGQTVPQGERTFEITLSCPDDVLVAGALSSAVWILQWAYSGGGDPRPDVAAIVDGLVALVQSVSGVEPDAADAEPAATDVAEPAAAYEAKPPAEAEVPSEVAGEPDAAAAEGLFDVTELDAGPSPAEAPSDTTGDADQGADPAWDMDGVPRPHLVR